MAQAWHIVTYTNSKPRCVLRAPAAGAIVADEGEVTTDGDTTFASNSADEWGGEAQHNPRYIQ